MSENKTKSTSTQIKDLITLVKSGKINKNDAFNELKVLLGQNKSANESGGDHDEEVENIPPPHHRPLDSEEEEQHQRHHQQNQQSQQNEENAMAMLSSLEFPSSSSATTPRFSKEDRRLLINKLIEKKRLDRAQQQQPQQQQQQQPHRYDQHRDEYERDDDENEIYEDERGVESPELSRAQPPSASSSHHRKGSPGSTARDRDDYHSQREQLNDASSISTIGLRSRSTLGYQSHDRRRPHSADPSSTSRSKSHSPSGYKSNPFTRRSYDDSKLSDYKNHKLSLQNDRIQQEIFKECTFTPKVKPLPVSIYGQVKDKDVQFYDRVMRWQREKELESTRRKSLTKQTEVDGCTFQPKINKNSSRAVKILRGTPTSGRQNSTSPTQRHNHSRNSSAQDTTLRLYESNAITQSQRSKFVEEEKQKEMKILREECTFQPRLLTKRSGYSHVDPKYDKVKTPTVQELKEKVIPPPKDCTFTPKVKGVRNSMSSAKLYLKMDVVDRLSKPVGSEPPQSSLSVDEEQYFDDRGVIDVASFMGSNSGYNTPTETRRPSSAPRDRRSSHGGGGPPVTQETEEEKEARRQSFQAFLGRQTQTKLRRDKKTEDLIRHSEPSFHPDVNPKSLKIVRQSRKGEFLDRVTQDVIRREQMTTRLVSRSSDPEHTFHPNLSSRGNKMRSRSIYEMSRGDLHKKETNQRILRLKTEQEELKNLTFQPVINSNQKNIRSTLQLNENPGGFLERHQLEQKQFELNRLKLLEERELNNLKECTFVPEIIECPQYIKRIARSLAVVKSSKIHENIGGNEGEKPQWK